MEKFLKLILLIATLYLLIAIGKYWYADHLYFLGKSYNQSADPKTAISYLNRAINLIPWQPLYHSEIALSYSQNNAGKAVAEILNAVNASPNNLGLRRSEFGIFIRLANTDPTYLEDAKDVAIALTKMAPTDPRVFYNLGLTYARLGDPARSVTALKKAVELKPNYDDAQTALNYILDNSKASK